MMGLARRSIESSIYNVVSHGLQIVILFFRSILLARLLLPETFGVYTFAQAIITTTLTFPVFGLGASYINRCPETEDPNAPAVYFTLISAFSLIWAIALILFGAFFLRGERRSVLWALAAITLLAQIAAPAETILSRQVRFGRLALLYLLTALLTSAASLWLAWRGAGVWSLVSVDLVSALILIVGLYLIRPVWQPRLVLVPHIVRYYLRLGSRTLLADLLVTALDRLDDLWTGRFLGDAALGFYSRAYTFANYPRRVLASPLNAVTLSSYAEVKHDRPRLSQAFSLANSLIIRAGFLFAGVLLLIAPEFTRWVLGAKWLPMLSAFRLMIAYTMLDPIRYTVGFLFTAAGRPELLVRVRLAQLAVLVLGLATLGPGFGIAGVALAATLMVVAGTVLSLWQARAFVDFGVLKLFAAPTIALAAGILIAYGGAGLRSAPASLISDVVNALVKALAFVLCYALIMLLLERREMAAVARLVQQALRRQPSAAAVRAE